MKKGISLIVLIITIIVVIILAAAVILTISNNNPISSAKEATFKEDIRSFQEELNAYVSNEIIKDTGGVRNKIIAEKYVKDSTNSEFENSVYKYITGFKEKYENKIGIYNDEIVYYKPDEDVKNKVTDYEEKWLQDLGIKLKIIETLEESFEWGSDDPNDEEYYTLNKFVGNETNVIVPARCHKISEKAFSYNVSIVSVKLQSGIVDIGKSAFVGCKELSSINFPEGITNIDDNAFSSCYKLNNVTLPNSINEVGIGRSAFSNCEMLEKIVIPNKIKFINTATFYGCINLKEVILPESLTGIYEQAFDGCTSLENIKFPLNISQINNGAFNNTGLKEVNIPKNVSYIGNGPFSSCKKLESIKVDNDNKYFIAENNVLYNMERTKIIQFPTGSDVSEFSIPNNVKEVCSRSFLGADTIEKINIPNTVTKIGYNTFHSCGNLKTINIPTSVETIGNYIFYGSPNLTIYCSFLENSVPSGWDKGWKGNAKNIVWGYTE